MTTLGDRIKQKIKEKGISQAELAELLNVSKQSVTGWIKGSYEPGVKLAYHMCMHLDCSIDWLVTGHERSALDAYRQATKKLFSQNINMDGEGNSINQVFGKGSLTVNEKSPEYKKHQAHIDIVEKYLKLQEKDRQAVAVLIESLSKKDTD